jgi:hypothetical protein
MNIGDAILKFINVEDITSAFILEVTDVYEVSLKETYFEISIKNISYVRNN